MYEAWVQGNYPHSDWTWYDKNYYKKKNMEQNTRENGCEEICEQVWQFLNTELCSTMFQYI